VRKDTTREKIKIISPGGQKLFVFLILTIIILAAYRQVNQFDFVNDDDCVYVTQNSHVQSGITADGLRWAFGTTYANGFWYPLI